MLVIEIYFFKTLFMQLTFIVKCSKKSEKLPNYVYIQCIYSPVRNIKGCKVFWLWLVGHKKLKPTGFLTSWPDSTSFLQQQHFSETF